MGTTKSVESKYSTPCNNLYPTCPWELKVLRKQIVDKKLAPIYKGLEEEKDRHCEECPICSLWYPVLNRVQCCKNSICTECYVQIAKTPPSIPPSVSAFKCPFCSIVGFSAVFKGPKPPFEREQERSDSLLYQKVQLRLKMESETAIRKKETEDRPVPSPLHPVDPPSPLQQQQQQ
ncbi:MAG: hypothetical protein Q8P67_11375, partial [archaeon]|nr:hypothetical protein [archaeon]